MVDCVSQQATGTFFQISSRLFDKSLSLQTVCLGTVSVPSKAANVLGPKFTEVRERFTAGPSTAAAAAIVADGAGELRKMCRDLNIMYGPCMCHAVSLAIRDVMTAPRKKRSATAPNLDADEEPDALDGVEGDVVIPWLEVSSHLVSFVTRLIYFHRGMDLTTVLEIRSYARSCPASSQACGDIWRWCSGFARATLPPLD